MKLPLLVLVILASCRAQTPAFEVASVKLNPAPGGRIRRDPGRLDITGMTLKGLVRYAYDVRDIQISGGPAWFDSDHWDIAATAGREVTDDERKKMLQALLTERFHMTIHRDTKDLPVYALVIAKNGLKLKLNTEEKPERVMLSVKSGLFTMMGEGVTASKFAEVLFGQVKRIVVDRTGIEGKFDYKLEWVPDSANMPSINGAKMEASTEGASIFTAVQEQLGLKLESTKAPVEILVIDRAEKATEN
jgi:uncharacterized protein (TIGR03435 family)